MTGQAENEDELKEYEYDKTQGRCTGGVTGNVQQCRCRGDSKRLLLCGLNENDSAEKEIAHTGRNKAVAMRSGSTVNHENGQDAAGVRVAFLVAARVRLRRAKTRESCLIEV